MMPPAPKEEIFHLGYFPPIIQLGSKKTQIPYFLRIAIPVQKGIFEMGL
jgi:hypothetical protein